MGLACGLLNASRTCCSPLRSPEVPMARSLHVKHEEKLGTSPLLNTFLVLAVGWMMIGAFLASAADAAPAITP